MMVRRNRGTVLVALAGTLACASAWSADDTREAPRWGLEFKGGEFEPDLDGYARFYGKDHTTFFAVAAAYRVRPWLEVGAEVGYMSDDGTGLLPVSDTPGGEVTYTLIPATAFVTLRGVFAAEQLLVPYLGAGVTAAYYDQDIEFQSGRSGTTDIGASFKAGIGLLLDRLDPRRGADRSRRALRNSYLFIEYQDFSTEAGNIELGGELYLIGLRMEFGRS